MKLKKNIATSESGLIFNPGTGDSFSINQTGTEILSKLRDDTNMEEIISSFIEKYDIDSLQLEKDIDDFLTLLSEYNLIDP